MNINLTDVTQEMPDYFGVDSDRIKVSNESATLEVRNWGNWVFPEAMDCEDCDYEVKEFFEELNKN